MAQPKEREGQFCHFQATQGPGFLLQSFSVIRECISWRYAPVKSCAAGPSASEQQYLTLWASLHTLDIF